MLVILDTYPYIQQTIFYLTGYEVCATNRNMNINILFNHSCLLFLIGSGSRYAIKRQIRDFTRSILVPSNTTTSLIGDVVIGM